VVTVRISATGVTRFPVPYQSKTKKLKRKKNSGLKRIKSKVIYLLYSILIRPSSAPPLLIGEAMCFAKSKQRGGEADALIWLRSAPHRGAECEAVWLLREADGFAKSNQINAI
jgi:hypothetical protein